MNVPGIFAASSPKRRSATLCSSAETGDSIFSSTNLPAWCSAVTISTLRADSRVRDRLPTSGSGAACPTIRSNRSPSIHSRNRPRRRPIRPKRDTRTPTANPRRPRVRRRHHRRRLLHSPDPRGPSSPRPSPASAAPSSRALLRRRSGSTRSTPSRRAACAADFPRRRRRTPRPMIRAHPAERIRGGRRSPSAWKSL